METAVLSKNRKLLLPKRLCKKYGFKPGDSMTFLETKQGLMLKAMDAEYFDLIVSSLKQIVPTIEEFKAWKESKG